MGDESVRNPESNPDEDQRFIRVPGLLRRWEIPQVVEPGDVLHIEQAGEDADGTPLYAVYRRDLPESEVHRQ